MGARASAGGCAPPPTSESGTLDSAASFGVMTGGGRAAKARSARTMSMSDSCGPPGAGGAAAPEEPLLAPVPGVPVCAEPAGVGCWLSPSASTISLKMDVASPDTRTSPLAGDVPSAPLAAAAALRPTEPERTTLASTGAGVLAGLESVSAARRASEG
eukprot:3539484-Prymnesium_polylepis.1